MCYKTPITRFLFALFFFPLQILAQGTTLDSLRPVMANPPTEMALAQENRFDWATKDFRISVNNNAGLIISDGHNRERTFDLNTGIKIEKTEEDGTIWLKVSTNVSSRLGSSSVRLIRRSTNFNQIRLILEPPNNWESIGDHPPFMILSYGNTNTNTNTNTFHFTRNFLGYSVIGAENIKINLEFPTSRLRNKFNSLLEKLEATDDPNEKRTIVNRLIRLKDRVQAMDRMGVN